MAVLDLYSKRRKAELRAGSPDVYQYDKVPQKLRVQIVHLWRDAIGTREPEYYHYSPESNWEDIHNALAREKGVMSLGSPFDDYRTRCENWFINTAEDDDALDLIELVARFIDRGLSGLDKEDRRNCGIKVSAADALTELNQRFQENGLGFRYENRILIRLDSQYVHGEVIRPALALLSEVPFAKANDDFMQAHKHYRDGLHKDCIVACQRAFESTLKAICSANNWPFNSGDRASELVTVVRNNGLLPSYLNKTLDTFVAMPKSGLPEVRNNAGGHGMAPDAPPVPPYIAAYALHLAAASIVMVVEAFKALPSG